MTSVRTCYCKHEENGVRKKDNDNRIQNGDRYPTTVVSKKLVVTNKTCGNGGESSRRARRVIDERTVDTNRSVEAQPSNTVLSPETSTALENAEKIINNAKIQLMEVCATSSFESARRNRNTYSEEPPLDDEAEELLYVRDLVASKFHEASSSRLSEANGKAGPRSEEHNVPRVTVRRVDLSAPKFRASRQRRRTDWSSSAYGSDDRSRGRASPARVPSRDSIGIADVATARDDCARDRRRAASARGNACGIQIGPSVHIADRELTRQDLEDVHISPEQSRARSRANTATYTLRHEVVQNADKRANEPGISGAPKTRRLDALRPIGKPTGKPIFEAIVEVVPTNPSGRLEKDFDEIGTSDSRQDDGRIESPKSQIRNYRPERRDRELDPRDAEGAVMSERSGNATGRGAAGSAAIETPETDKSEKLRDKPRNENHEEIISGGDTAIRYAEDGEVFRKRSGADRLRSERNAADEIQEEDRSDRSKPRSPARDASRKSGFPRRESTASRCREAESPRPCRTIDGHFSHTFNSHNGQDGLYDAAGDDAHRRSFASGCSDDSRPEDYLDEIDLYRPRLDDLDSVLHSNDRRIERVVRAANSLGELLSGPEFAIYKLNEDGRVPQDARREKSYQDSSADEDCKCPVAPNEQARPSVLVTDLRNGDLTVSRAPGIRRTDEDLRGANAAETKSSAFTWENGARGNYPKNSAESSVFPASDASDDPGTSRDSDKARRSAGKPPLSESSMDRSDVTTFSSLVPALSSTHTETQTCSRRRHREGQIARGDRHAGAKSRVTSANKSSEIRRSGKECTDDGVFAQFPRRDASEAADRFVAYILQDEKRSVEGKIASALKESAIAPAAMQKLLDHLRAAESIRDARQTETLDILRNILINVKSQSDRERANDRETSPTNVPDPSARANAPPSAIGFGLTSRGEVARQTLAKIDASEIGRVGKSFHELEGPDEYSSDFSERCRRTRWSGRSTARCESTRTSENNRKRNADQTESADVARTIPIDAESQMDKVVQNDPRKGETMLLRNVADSSIQMGATSNPIEGSILRTQAKNNTNDTGQIADKSNDIGSTDKQFSGSPAFREAGESVVRSAAHSESARSSKNNSENSSKGNSCSEAGSLKQISDIHSDENENPEESSEHLSTKIASARSRGGRKVEAADSDAAIAVSENKEEDISNEGIGGNKSTDVQANEDQPANKIVMQTDQATDARLNIPKEALKEITSEKTHDDITPVDKRLLFAVSEVSEVSEIKKEPVHADGRPAGPKFVAEVPAKRDADLLRLPAQKATESLRGTENDLQLVVVREKISPADSCPADPARDCVSPSAKDSKISQEVASRNRQISFNIAGEDNLLRDTRNDEIRGRSMTFAAVENRRDGTASSGHWGDDNERRPIDLADASRKCKIDVLSGSNSSVSSALLDPDDRSTNGVSGANAKRIVTTPETTSHSEGELYMPSSCSYSLGEVRVLRRKRDLIEDNTTDRDSSATVLVTRSMLTSLNDSTASLLESSGRV